LRYWGAVILLFIILGLKGGSIGSSDCPGRIDGNLQSNITVRYFFSPFCPACWQQERIFDGIIDDLGSSLSLEKFDIRYCAEEARSYRVGAPGFVFHSMNETFVERGLLSRDKLELLIKQGFMK